MDAMVRIILMYMHYYQIVHWNYTPIDNIK